MKNSPEITEDQKYEAAKSCDKNYDGRFFYGVTTTGIFCRPSCNSKTPLRDNIVFFDNARQAIMKGFRPCKKCRPDDPVFEPNLQLLQGLKEIFDQNYDKKTDSADLIKQSGISPNHLRKLFKQYYGHTPVQYITRLRIKKAVSLLKETDMKVLEIAYISGFNSLSNFNKCLKEQTAQTAKQHREKR